jgi:glycosyltransferase involved in cell wall biosynthesis
VERRTKVAFFISGLPFGGAEMMLMKLISAMDRSRFQPVVISLSDGGALAAPIEALDTRVHCLGIQRGLGAASGWTKLRKLRQIVAHERPTVLQGWMYYGNLAATIAGGGIPIVWGVRGSLPQEGLQGHPWMTRWIIRTNAVMSWRARAIVYNSRLAAAQHERIGFSASKSRWIPNGFDTLQFSPDLHMRTQARRELGVDPNEILIGLIARYHPMKGHENFLKAAALLASRVPRVRFVLVGTNVDNFNSEINKYISQERLGSKILLLGERLDVPNLTRALDIATCSSSEEAFPNVLGEAMACGVPCVATNVGDCAWVLGEAGLAVPRDDPGALAAAWEHLVNMGREGRNALGAIGRGRVEKFFTLSTVAREYEALYEDVMSQCAA